MRSSNSTMVKKGHTSFLLERATVSLLSKSAVENFLKKKSQSDVVRLKKKGIPLSRVRGERFVIIEIRCRNFRGTLVTDGASFKL